MKSEEVRGASRCRADRDVKPNNLPSTEKSSWTEHGASLLLERLKQISYYRAATSLPLN